MQTRRIGEEQILTGLVYFSYFMLGVYQAEYYFIPIITLFYSIGWLFLRIRFGGDWLQATAILFVMTSILGFVLYFFGKLLFAS